MAKENTVELEPIDAGRCQAERRDGSFMSLGIPIIVSNTKIDRYYFNESCVKFFKSGDEKDLAKCIIQLKNDVELRKKNVFNALKFVEKNNWEVKKHIYLDLVDSLVGQNGCQ